MTSFLKVALITGGASGMGLAVAQPSSIEGRLIQPSSRPQRRAWRRSCIFHRIISILSPNQYRLLRFSSLSIRTQKRINFVLANAGIAEHANFYADTTPTHYHEVAGLDPIVDIDLKSVVGASYLAPHYFCKSPDAKDKYLVMTESCGGLYTSYYSPIYTATKHEFIGLMRGIARYFWFQNKIRVNAICPGVVGANLLDVKEWANFLEEYFTHVEKIAGYYAG